MQSCEISQNRYKCYNPLPKTHGSTTTTTVDCSNETIYGQNIPRMKLLKINYVNPDLSKHNPCLDTTTFQITDNIKPSFYKYAVYKKLNGDNQQNRLQNYNKNNLMSNDENPRVHKDRISYPAQNSGQILLLNSNSNHRSKIKVHHSPRDTWNIKMIADTPLNQSGIKTRATRLENIEKGSCSNEMLKFNKSDEITQISKIFEHARKEQQSITPSCNNSSKISSSSSILSSSSSILSSSTTTGDKKIKKLADDLQFNCYCSNMKNLNENSSYNKKKVTANPQNFCTSECRTKMKSPSSTSSSSSIQPLNKFDEGVNNNNKIQKLFDLIPPDDQQDRLLQEKILHHHQRLNRNQDRITDLKKYAKRSNSMSNHCPMERIHLRKTAAKRRQPLLVTNDAEMNIDGSKKIDQPLTNKIKLEQQSFRNTCGYHQNCKFSQCPISNETGSMVQDHGKDFTTSKYINMSPPQAVLDKVISSPLQDIKISSSSVQEKFNDLNDVQNFSGKSVTKVTTDEMLMSSTLNNTVNKNPKHKSDIDVNLKNNENRKFNDLRSGSGSGGSGVRHSLKNSSLSSHSLSSDTTSTSTESDYSYYDQAAASVVSTEDTPSTDNLDCRVSDNLQIQDVLRPKLGCDGAIFWNNCYFYDDSFCTKCSFTSSDCRDFQPVNYICFCSSRKTDIHDLRPRSLEGGIDSGISFNGDSGSSPDCDLHSQQDTEARRLKRGHVLTELLETERIYVTEMNSILRGYRDQMLSEEMAHLVPASLQGKEDVLFGNLHELYTFHSEIFLKDLENCISTTELVALCFVQRRDTFYRLYSFYCQNIPRSERLRETLVDTHLFLQECQKRLGHKLPLAAYLLKPVQRITKYQLLLKDLLRFSDSGTCTKELQKALDCMLIVLKCVNDSMHQIAITGFPADLSQQGELLLQDSFQVWTESKKDIRLRLKTQHRHIFLYQKAMLFCKQASKTGHNKSTYQFKHYLKMSQIGLTESVRGDPKRFEVWLQGRQEVHTIQAPNVEIKNKWVSEIKRVLLNQLEELKGEKIKQYGLNHRPLRQTVSWDTPASNLSTPQRTMSCDTAEANRTTNGSDECPPQTPGISSSSSEKDNPDVGGWSSDYSNSEDELSIIEDNSTPGSRFIALADYCAVGHSEVSMKEGDTVELLKIGCAGWWFVKVLGSNAEGWTPAAYLEPTNRKSSRSSSRNQDRIN